jgi:hypothetical protein
VTAKIDALSVSCPQCGAEVGARCWSGTRRGRRLQRGSHAARVRRARGEDVPDSFEVTLRREIDRVRFDVLSKEKP